MILKLKENLYVNKNKMIKVLQNTPLLFFFVTLLVGMRWSPRGCLQVQTFCLWFVLGENVRKPFVTPGRSFLYLPVVLERSKCIFDFFPPSGLQDHQQRYRTL